MQLRESREATRLELVVELLAEARADHREHLLRLEAFAAERADEALEDAGVREVALDRLDDARMLHLDRDLAPVDQLRHVDLADRRAREGLVAPAREEAVDGRAELRFDARADLRRRRPRRRRLQRLHRSLVRLALPFGDDAVDVACHLPDLGGQAAESAQHLRRMVCASRAASIEQSARAAS